MLVFPNGTHVKGEGARAGGFTKSRLSTEGHFLRSDSGRWLWSLEFACAFFFPPGGGVRWYRSASNLQVELLIPSRIIDLT